VPAEPVAPALRATLTCAGIVIACAILWSLLYPATIPAPRQPWRTSQSVAPQMNSASARSEQATPSSNRRVVVTSPRAVAPVRLLAPADPARQEELILARCHPAYHAGTVSLPQIDVSQMPDPGAGHLKIRFFVNGSGEVTRAALTSANFASPEEQAAELEFTKRLTFVVPDTAECRTREMELVGDFVAMKGPTGQWATFVRLYPHFSVGSDGMLQTRE
jgi:hypothetical protein